MLARLEATIDGLRQARSLEGLTDFVCDLRTSLEVDHLIYHSVHSTGRQYAALTYKPEWVERYLAQDYARIDPVVQGCYRSFSPIDWRLLDWTSRSVRAFQNEAGEMGIGRQGMSVPIRGPNGQFALFTVNDSRKEGDWGRFCERMGSDLLLISHFVNQQALLIEAGGETRLPPTQALSPRETDVLTYLALGYSRAQAADHLRISEHTVRVYIESARVKLTAHNTTHAVARALILGLLVV